MKFLIGQQQVPFTIPDQSIVAGTFLYSYLNIGMKKNIKTVKAVEVDEYYPETEQTLSIQYYVLEEEDPDLFRHFVSFLSGGDFAWNEEIAEYFTRMGYINTMNYPLDYWKIKLIDNWIRDNFYSLELYKADSTLPSLEIKRGPYVGLQDITHLFASNFMTNQLIQPKDLHTFNEHVNFKHLVLAGGSLITLLMDYPRQPADLDFFLIGCNEEEAKEEIGKFVKEYPTINIYHSDNSTNISSNYTDKIVLTKNAITFGKKKPKSQIVLRLYTCPSEVVHGFDVDACGILYDGQKIWATHRAAYSIQAKTNFFDFARMSETYGHRLAKYASRGFRVWMPNFDSKKVRWNNLRRLKDDITNYGDKTEGMSEYTDLAPYYLPRGQDMQYLRDNYNIQKIINHANPIDLIIFAQYFRYLPYSMPSDYNKDYNQENKKKLVILPRGDVHEESTDAGIYINTYADYWEYIGKGFVILFPDENDVPLESILTRSQEAIELSGLPQHLTFMKHNPMQQLTGTFNPTRLDDLNIWYDNAYLYSSDNCKVEPLFPSVKPPSLPTIPPRVPEVGYLPTIRGIPHIPRLQELIHLGPPTINSNFSEESSDDEEDIQPRSTRRVITLPRINNIGHYS